MDDWVPVMVPPDLAPAVLRQVATHLEGSGAGRELRLWEDATASDVKDLIGQLSDEQRELVVSLAHSSKLQSTGAHAQRLGKSIEEIAGYVGPINKRAKKAGWASPLRSHRHFSGNKSEKVLVLDDRVAQWVRDHHEEA